MGTVDFITQTVSWIRFCVFLAARMAEEYCECGDSVQNHPSAIDRFLADELSLKPLETPLCCALPDQALVPRG